MSVCFALLKNHTDDMTILQCLNDVRNKLTGPAKIFILGILQKSGGNLKIEAFHPEISSPII